MTTFWGNFWKHLGHFLSQHLVTLNYGGRRFERLTHGTVSETRIESAIWHSTRRLHFSEAWVVHVAKTGLGKRLTFPAGKPTLPDEMLGQVWRLWVVDMLLLNLLLLLLLVMWCSGQAFTRWLGQVGNADAYDATWRLAPEIWRFNILCVTFGFDVAYEALRMIWYRQCDQINSLFDHLQPWTFTN